MHRVSFTEEMSESVQITLAYQLSWQVLLLIRKWMRLPQAGSVFRRFGVV
jgi:energy-converting hydrogenase Eha subunit B